MTGDEDVFAGDMLHRVWEVDPGADADAVRRYAHEIAAAGDVLQSLDLDPSMDPLPTQFSPDWVSEQPQ